MIIELKGVNFENKGAELMLHAIVQEISKRLPDAKLVMEPKMNTFAKRSNLGLYQKLPPNVKGVNVGLWIDRFIHPKLKSMFGVVSEKEIDVVLDASGLAYSDQWGPRATKVAAAQFKRMKKNGSKVIMLPQAIGPLEGDEILKHFKVICKQADLIFARDSVSYKYCMEVCNDDSKIKMSPDFTNLVNGLPSESFDPENKHICVIPNYRMIDKVEKSDRYIPMMVNVIKELENNNEKVFLLIHEGEKDLWLAKEINKRLDVVVEIITESNPLKIKWIIGQSKAVISSRFHGLVSGLSQGIPSLGTGWNHKYKMLFENYGFEEGLLSLQLNEGELKNKLNWIIDDTSSKQLRDKISRKAQLEKEKTKLMWNNTVNVITDTKISVS